MQHVALFDRPSLLGDAYNLVEMVSESELPVARLRQCNAQQITRNTKRHIDKQLILTSSRWMTPKIKPAVSLT